MTTAEKIYAGTSWIPLAGFLGVILYARQFEGWGAWGTAGLALIPIGLSFAMLLVGISMWAAVRKSERSSVPVALSTLLAGSVFVFIAVKFLLS